MADKTEATCSVCHSAPFKYRCPRCPTVRTCSLPCYKRHQQRATCTGQRNESTYLKKSQLNSAAAIDHDFNFLSKVEREMKTAEEAADEGARQPKRRRLASNSAFENYVAMNKITVHTAPAGLHRAKTNQSRFLPKAKKVAWTVEWVGENDTDKDKKVTEVLEDESVWVAYSTMAARHLGGPKKMKHKMPKHVVEGQDSETISITSATLSENTQDAGELDSVAETCTLASENGEAQRTASAHGPPAVPASDAGVDDAEPIATPETKRVYLYLLRPRCVGDRRVLYPLEYSVSLTEALRNQHVDEFPTIYHLPYSPSELPEDRFWTSQHYEVTLETEIKGIDKDAIARQVQAHQSGRSIQADRKNDDDDRWDSQRVLEMLRRDVDGRASGL